LNQDWCIRFCESEEALLHVDKARVLSNERERPPVATRAAREREEPARELSRTAVVWLKKRQHRACDECVSASLIKRRRGKRRWGAPL
jgi:hypothetical protein